MLPTSSSPLSHVPGAKKSFNKHLQALGKKSPPSPKDCPISSTVIFVAVPGHLMRLIDGPRLDLSLPLRFSSLSRHLLMLRTVRTEILILFTTSWFSVLDTGESQPCCAFRASISVVVDGTTRLQKNRNRLIHLLFFYAATFSHAKREKVKKCNVLYFTAHTIFHVSKRHTVSIC